MVVLLYKRHAKPDDHVLDFLEKSLAAAGYQVFVDRHLKIGVEWARAIEGAIREAEAVIPILSDAATGSEMLEYELETAADGFRKTGRPRILPVRVGTDSRLEGPLGNYVNEFQYAFWCGPEDDESLLAQIREALDEPQPRKPLPIEPTGGAVAPNSRFYTWRETDAEFDAALRANESIVLVKGPRQVGKTSLIGRGALLVEELGWRQASTDFQTLSASQFADEAQFTRLLAALLARQTGFAYDFENEWLDIFGPGVNLDHFLRALLESSDQPFVWFMDEADRIFGSPFASDFFGLVRSWHNARARDPRGPWSRFTVVIGYATEARLFIQDLNQSPFNVGRQIPLRNFTVEQVEDLNRKYGEPITRRSDLSALHFLVAGQPFLTRRALELLATGKLTFSTLMETADADDGPFGDHLKRTLIAVSHVPSVLASVRSSLAMLPLSSRDGVDRLIAAGVLKELPDGEVDLACDLYARYLSRHVG
ncbi:MAG: AAA-like domain-containing protein [Fimbriimonas sp.]